ncbi:MAG: SpoIIE family protein phosphatase [Pseudomonadota bacterium]
MAELNPPKILVVDDEPDMRVLIEQKFRRAIRRGELIFEFAGNGVEALSRLADDTEITMVISDINMPEMDGLTLLGQLNQVNPNIRAVIVSAYGDLENIRSAMNRGAYDFLTKPINFDDFDRTLQKTLAHLQDVQKALADRDQLVSLGKELDIARDIQQSVLPTRFPSNQAYSLHGAMQPTYQVGGDFYDFVTLPGGRFGLIVGDVSGKGVPAALFMMLSQAVVRSLASSCQSPAELLRSANEQLALRNQTLMFLTLFYAIYDPADGSLVYASGGHERPLLLSDAGQVRSLANTSGMALGINPAAEYSQNEIVLQQNELLFCFTDGVIDAINSDAMRFGAAGLHTALAQTSRTQTARQVTEAVEQALIKHVGGMTQEDDITWLCLKHQPATPHHISEEMSHVDSHTEPS